PPADDGRGPPASIGPAVARARRIEFAPRRARPAAMSVVRQPSIVDYHTEGEPMRIVTSGVDSIPGATMLDRMRRLATSAGDLLGLILREPRGHAAMCGAILTDTPTPGADAGVLFIEPLGPVLMCGHGAMAVAAMLVESGAVTPSGPEASITLDTPAGPPAWRRVSGERSR